MVHKEEHSKRVHKQLSLGDGRGKRHRVEGRLRLSKLPAILATYIARWRGGATGSRQAELLVKSAPLPLNAHDAWTIPASQRLSLLSTDGRSEAASSAERPCCASSTATAGSRPSSSRTSSLSSAGEHAEPGAFHTPNAATVGKHESAFDHAESSDEGGDELAACGRPSGGLRGEAAPMASTSQLLQGPEAEHNVPLDADSPPPGTRVPMPRTDVALEPNGVGKQRSCPNREKRPCAGPSLAAVESSVIAHALRVHESLAELQRLQRRLEREVLSQAALSGLDSPVPFERRLWADSYRVSRPLVQRVAHYRLEGLKGNDFKEILGVGSHGKVVGYGKFVIKLVPNRTTFINEAAATLMCGNGCPHVIKLLGVVASASGERGLLLPRFGCSLRALHRHVAFSSLATQMSIMRQILQGLAKVHAAGFLHLDIKPENILVQRVPAPDGSGSRWSAMICDFGMAVLASLCAAKDASTGMRMFGTNGFRPPELEGDQDGSPASPGCPVTASADVYSLGATMLELFRGRDLDPAEVRRLQSAPSSGPLAVIQRRMSVDEVYLAILSACLRRNPAHRPSVSDLLINLNIMRQWPQGYVIPDDW